MGAEAPREGHEAKRDVIYERILLDIICRDLQPGEQIAVGSLAERYGVGRMGVSDALFRLALEGQVERRPRLGSIVASPSLIELQQVFHLRVQLEGQAARLAALNATEAEMAEIKEAYEGAEQVIAARDWRALICLDRNFHRAIANATHNRFIARILPDLQNNALRLWHYSLPRRSPDALQKEIEYHRAVADAIGTRDASAAEAAMQSVLEEFPSTIRELFADP